MNKLSPGRIFARLATLLALCLAPTWLPAAPAYDAQVINPDLSGGLLLPDGKTLLLWGSDATILRSEDGTPTHRVRSILRAWLRTTMAAY
jgi:hypothetical protein